MGDGVPISEAQDKRAGKDIEQIRLIHNLVKVRGFKLSAAKKIINSNRDGADRTADMIERLTSVREELILLKRQLDGMQ